MESPFIHEHLIMEILSCLPVKSLVRFQSVSNSFLSLISDPMFVKMHLKKSSKRANFLITYKDRTLNHSHIVSCTLSFLLDNSSSSSSPLDVNHPGLVFNVKHKYEIVATCNGLVCLVSRLGHHQPYKFCLWNPATGQKFKYPPSVLSFLLTNNCINMFGFGYDTTTDKYKFVALLSIINPANGSLKSCKVKVCTVGDNGWRSIQDFPGDPISIVQGCGVYLNNSLNWIASSIPLNRFIHHEDPYVTCDNLVIVSLDMGSEKYTRLLLPQALDGVYTNVFSSVGYNSVYVPRIGVLNNCLSLFLIDSNTGHFSIWQVKEFENRNSWIRLVHITTMQDIDFMPQPLCMYQKDSALMIAYHRQFRAIFYNGIDNLVKYTEFSNNILTVHEKNYVPSLVSPTIE